MKDILLVTMTLFVVVQAARIWRFTHRRDEQEAACAECPLEFAQGLIVGLLVALAMLASCATVPPPTPTPCPTPDCDAYTVACANLAHIGCADGLAASCPAVLRELATGEPLMFLFDQWEELEADPRMDAKTLRAARELADNMCAIIFERMGLTTITDGLNLQVTGRGLRYVFPLREEYVYSKYKPHRQKRSANKLRSIEEGGTDEDVDTQVNDQVE